MAVKKVGTLIREARTAKKLSQEQLASGIDGLSGSDIGKAERGEKDLSQTHLKAIAKALGITQKSLLEAPKGGSSATTTSKTTSASKTTASKTAAARKTTSAKSTTASKTASATAKKTSSATSKKTASGTTGKTTSVSSLSAAEQKLIELYRAAASDDKKLATRILKGEKLGIADLLPMLMASGAGGEDGQSGGLLSMLQNLAK
ncbi:MAG: helix-turn-helix transcriptional regulator [Oscillospiraceae bacterium]|nr:helix-turn-helix transcriptional regulator [Oscillospiraceae bacterium]